MIATETNPAGASEPNQGRQTRLGGGEDACSPAIKLEVPEKSEGVVLGRSCPAVTGSTLETKSKMRLQHSTPSPKSNRRRKLQFSQPSRHLDLAEAAFQRWRQIGAAVGLSDDSDIASFLMQHYETTSTGSQSSTHCSSCQAPLILTCVTCNPSPTSTHRSLPASACDVLSQNDDDDDDDGGGGKFCWNGQDAVKVCGIDMDLSIEDEKEGVQISMKQTVPHKGKLQKRKCKPPSPGSPSPPSPSSSPLPPPPSPPPPEQPEEPRKKRPPIQHRQPSKRKSSNSSNNPLSAETFPQPPSGAVHLRTRKERQSGVFPSPQRGIRLKTARKPDPASKPVTTVKEPVSDVVRASEGERRHVCSECGASFSRRGGLKVHMRIHTGEKPFKCQECHMAFNQSVGLIAHQRKHTGERPYVCAECGASFPLASTLNQHCRIHSGERPFSCPHCHKAFCRSGDLSSHLRVHTGLRPFLCHDCGKRFASSSDLTKHKRTHTGDRPFQCPQCLKKFPFPHRLTVHMRRHTGDKPFLCTVCGAAFARASNLTVHFRTHTGDKPFECEECGKRFSDSANLCKHRRNSHRQLGRKLDQRAGSDMSACSSSEISSGVGAVTASRTSKTAGTVSVCTDLPAASDRVLRGLPHAVPSPSLTPNSHVTHTVLHGSKLQPGKDSSTTKHASLSEASLAASAVPASLSESAPAFRNVKGYSEAGGIFSLFDPDRAAVDEGAEGRDRQAGEVVMCKHCCPAASFPNPSALLSHYQTVHWGLGDKVAMTVPTGGGGGGGSGEGCGSSEDMQAPGQEEEEEEEEECTSLSPYFTAAAAALGYYSHQ